MLRAASTGKSRGTVCARSLSGLCALLGLVLLGACGGPSLEPSSTPTDTANAFLAASEAEDAARIETMMTSDLKQAGAMFGASAAKEVQKNREQYGAPVKGQGRVLKVDETGGTAVAHVAILHDNKCPSCKPAGFLPDWAPAGSYVDTDKITLQKGEDGRWVITNWEESSYLSDQLRSATSTAQALSGTATAMIAQATQFVRDSAEADLNALYMLSPTEGWAVGEGVVLEYNGDRWSPVKTSAYQNIVLKGMHMLSPSDGWAVGTGYTGILHYTGSEWLPISADEDQQGAYYSLSDVYMVSPTEGWAVEAPECASGYGRCTGSILHYLEKKWQRLDDTNLPLLNQIQMLSATEGWAAGNGILHYKNGKWEPKSFPTMDDMFAPGFIRGLHMLSPTDGWAVGFAGVDPLLLHYVRGQWERVESPTNRILNSVYMVSTSDGWAVGQNGTILHFTGRKWELVESPTKVDLKNVQMVSPSEGWAVGAQGVILHYRDGTWEEYKLASTPSTPASLPAVTFTANAGAATALLSPTISTVVGQPTTMSSADATALANGLPVGVEGAFDPYYQVTPTEIGQEVPLAEGVKIKLSSSPYCKNGMCGTTGVESECGGLMMWVFEIRNQGKEPFLGTAEAGTIRQITDNGDAAELAEKCYGFDAVNGVLTGEKSIEPGSTGMGMILFKTNGWSKNTRNVELSMIIAGQGVTFSYPVW